MQKASEMDGRLYQENTISGFVLVGGASSRMGRSKALLEFDGSKLFERAGTTLRSVCTGDVTLVGHGSDSLASISHLDLKAVPDVHISGKIDLGRAALIGVYSALRESKRSWAAILACDLPFVTAELVQDLGGRATDNIDAVVPLQIDSRPQPLCAVYNSDRCIPVIEEMLCRGEARMRDLLSRIETSYVPFAEIGTLPGAENFFLNVNRPEDLERARAIRCAASA